MWQLFLAPPSFIVLSVSHTKSQNGFSFAFWHPSKTTAHNLCILRIHRTQPNRYLYNHKHGSHNCLAPFINTWPACGRRSPPSTTLKNSQWWAALSLNLQRVVWISQQNMPASNIEWDVYGPAARPLPSATGAKWPHFRAQQDADNERACAESRLSSSVLRSWGRMFAGNSAKLHPPAARRLQQQPSGRAEKSKHPCTNGSVDCQ